MERNHLKINCPYHDDRTASMHVYETNAHCFGCGVNVHDLTKLGLENKVTKEPAYVEDVKATLSYISTLPARLIRGFSLPADSLGYYIVWPTNNYYKRRLFDPKPGDPKYVGPAGVRKPMFIVRQNDSKTLALVEGELNAKSVARAYPGIAVASPGGSGDFHSSRFQQDLQFYRNYETILVIADLDQAGAIAAIEFKARVMHCVPDTRIMLMPTDANEILITHGKQALKKEVQRYLEVPKRVYNDK